MALEFEVPEWGATGTEPDDSKKKIGWELGEKPPSDWFNWFFNRTSIGLEYIKQNVLSSEAIQQMIDDAEVPKATKELFGTVRISDNSNDIVTNQYSEVAASVRYAVDISNAMNTMPYTREGEVTNFNNMKSTSGKYVIPNVPAVTNAPPNYTDTTQHTLIVDKTDKIIRQTLIKSNSVVFFRTGILGGFNNLQLQSIGAWTQLIGVAEVDTKIKAVTDVTNPLNTRAFKYRSIPEAADSLNSFTQNGYYYVSEINVYANRPLNQNGQLISGAAFIHFYDDPTAALSNRKTKQIIILLDGTDQKYERTGSAVYDSTSGTTTFTFSNFVVATTQSVSGVLSNVTGVAGSFNIPDSLRVTKDVTASGNIYGTSIVSANGVRATGGISVVYASDMSGKSRWAAHISAGSDLYFGRSSSVDADNFDFAKGIYIRGGDTKLVNNGRVILDEIDSVKQSGVDRKNELVYWISANSGSASVNEDMSVLITKLGQIANTRYKEGYTQTSGSPSGGGDVIWMFPSGFNARQRTQGNTQEGSTNLVSISTYTPSNSYVDLYARDGVGREIYMGAFPAVTSGIAYYYVSGVDISQSYINVYGYRGAGGTNNPISFSKQVTGGFDISSGVRFVFVKRNYSTSSGNGFPNVTANNTLVYGG